MSADDRGITQKQTVKSVFPSLVWHQLTFPGAVSTGHSIYNAYVITDHV